MPLPSNYPSAAVETATLLERAHMVEPPYAEVRAAAPWLKGDGEVRSYFEGAIQGRIRSWRYGPLLPNDVQ